MNETSEKQESNIGQLRFAINERPSVLQITRKILLDTGIHQKSPSEKTPNFFTKNWLWTLFCILQVTLWLIVINYPVVLKSAWVYWCQGVVFAGILFGAYLVLREKNSTSDEIDRKKFKKVTYYPFVDDLSSDLENRFKKYEPMVLSIQDPEFTLDDSKNT